MYSSCLLQSLPEYWLSYGLILFRNSLTPNHTVPASLYFECNPLKSPATVPLTVHFLFLIIISSNLQLYFLFVPIISTEYKTDNIFDFPESKRFLLQVNDSCNVANYHIFVIGTPIVLEKKFSDIVRNYISTFLHIPKAILVLGAFSLPSIAMYSYPKFLISFRFFLTSAVSSFSFLILYVNREIVGNQLL